jgi:hypothetical protein
MHDEELLSLSDFLLFLKDKGNFQSYLDEHFSLRKFSEHQRADELISRLVSNYKKRRVF